MQKFNSPVTLLGEGGFLVKIFFVGHGIFKGIMTKILSPRTNTKTYRIKNDNGDEEDITLQELKTLIIIKQKQNTCYSFLQ